MLLDHFHSPLKDIRPWTGFHGMWAGKVASAINRRLPEGWFAAPTVHWDIEIDVAAFEQGGRNHSRGCTSGSAQCDALSSRQEQSHSRADSGQDPDESPAPRVALALGVRRPVGRNNRFLRSCHMNCRQRSSLNDRLIWRVERPQPGEPTAWPSWDVRPRQAQPG